MLGLEQGFQLVVGTSTELEVALREYKLAIRQGGASVRTVKTYGWHLDKLLLWLAERGATTPRSVTRVLLREWGASLYDYWQPSTIKPAISAVRSFFRWMEKERLADDNPADALKTPPDPERIQRTVYPDEVVAMIAACNIETSKGLRDRAIISLLFDSGLRAAEICRVKLSDLEMDRRRLKVVVKGGKEGRALFGEKTAERLRAWLWVRVAVDGVENLFVSVGGTTPGKQMTSGGVSKELSKLGKRVGLAGISAHAFRRGFAVQMTLQGIPNSVLQEIGRWEDEKMIKRYTKGLEAEIMYRGKSPVDGLE